MKLRIFSENASLCIVKLKTASLLKNCVGVIKDKSRSVNILLIYSAVNLRIH